MQNNWSAFLSLTGRQVRPESGTRLREYITIFFLLGSWSFQKQHVDFISGMTDCFHLSFTPYGNTLEDLHQTYATVFIHIGPVVVESKLKFHNWNLKVAFQQLQMYNEFIFSHYQSFENVSTEFTLFCYFVKETVRNPLFLPSVLILCNMRHIL